MLPALKRLFIPDPTQLQAHAAYVCLVTQARKTFFYSDWQVADTLDGRFDIILLHLSLAMERCRGAEGAEEFLRLLPEVFFADMDRSLREMGAGDTGIGRRVQAMAQALYGRLDAYQRAGDTTLGETLKRNVYRNKPVDPTSVSALASYVLRNREGLRRQPVDVLLRGNILFSD